VIFTTASLAKRIEQAESVMLTECAEAAGSRLPEGEVYIGRAGGGVAVFTEPGAPFNKLAGLGFEPLNTDSLAEIEREFARRKALLQVELASLADPAVGTELTRRGYELTGFENVLGLELQQDALRMSGDRETPAITRATPEESRLWMDVVTTGFLSPDAFDGPVSHESFDRATLERVYADTIASKGFVRYLARRDGVIAGGASLRMGGGVAQLSGAATLPDHRRRGVQTALLRTRLADAFDGGCDIAVVTTQPGSKSTENVQRFGFALLYVRAILVKAPA